MKLEMKLINENGESVNGIIDVIQIEQLKELYGLSAIDSMYKTLMEEMIKYNKKNKLIPNDTSELSND